MPNPIIQGEIDSENAQAATATNLATLLTAAAGACSGILGAEPLAPAFAALADYFAAQASAETAFATSLNAL